MTIREAILSIMQDEFSWTNIRIAKVMDVSEVDRTCIVETLDTLTLLDDVRLQADTGEAISILPKPGKFVAIAPISENDYIVVGYSEAAYIQLGNGSFGGLVKAQDVATKLNNLEGKVNDLISTLQGIVVPLAPSGTYPFAPEFASMTPLVETEPEELENPDIEHGSL